MVTVISITKDLQVNHFDVGPALDIIYTSLITCLFLNSEMGTNCHNQVQKIRISLEHPKQQYHPIAVYTYYTICNIDSLWSDFCGIICSLVFSVDADVYMAC